MHEYLISSYEQFPIIAEVQNDTVYEYAILESTKNILIQSDKYCHCCSAPNNYSIWCYTQQPIHKILLRKRRKGMTDYFWKLKLPSEFSKEKIVLKNGLKVKQKSSKGRYKDFLTVIPK